MPCRCDYTEPSALEIEIRHLCYFIDEINGIKHPFKLSSGGYSTPYSSSECNKKLADKLTAELCGKLKETDITKYSLEMQIWWRDHQDKDSKREQEEENKKKREEIRKAALSKLTKAEKEALGLK